MPLVLPPGSRLSLAQKCIGSVLLPQTKEEKQHLEDGKSVHSALEAYFKSGRQIDPGLDDDRLKFVRLVDGAVGRCGSEFAELGVGLDPDQWDQVLVSGIPGVNGLPDPEHDGHTRSGDVVRQGGNVVIGRLPEPVLLQPGAERREDDSSKAILDSDRSRYFIGFADLAQLGCAGEIDLKVWDWKTGHTWVATPEWNWQLILTAVAIWCCLGKPEPFKAELNILQLGDGTGEPKTQTFVADADFLQSKLYGLQWLKRRLEAGYEDGRYTLYEGKHCTFCPAWDRCPAKVGPLREMASALVEKPESLSHQDMIRWWLHLKDSMKKFDDGAYEILERNGNIMVLPDGREAVLARDKKNRRKVFTRKGKGVGQAKETGPVSNQTGPDAGTSSDSPGAGDQEG